MAASFAALASVFFQPINAVKVPRFRRRRETGISSERRPAKRTILTWIAGHRAHDLSLPREQRS
jgi:hypothetical protein